MPQVCHWTLELRGQRYVLDSVVFGQQSGWGRAVETEFTITNVSSRKIHFCCNFGNTPRQKLRATLPQLEPGPIQRPGDRNIFGFEL